MTRLYIVRHGETEWNVAGKIQGQQDSQLTEKGRQQARQLREKLQNVHFDAVFSSDLSRAKETASILIEGHELELKHSDQLRERAQGSLEGYHRHVARQEYSDMYALFDQANDQERMHIKIVPDSETLQEAADRFTNQIRAIAKAHDDETVLVVTHGMVMRCFLFIVGLAEFSKVEHVENLGYLIIESDGEKFTLIDSSGVVGLDKQALDKFPKKG